MDRIFKPPFSMTGAISQDGDRCQFLFCLMKNPLFVAGGSAGERSGSALFDLTRSAVRGYIIVENGSLNSYL
jgi:hypothetical protein